MPSSRRRAPPSGVISTLRSFVIHYSVFDIRHSEKYESIPLAIATQPELPHRHGNRRGAMSRTQPLVHAIGITLTELS